MIVVTLPLRIVSVANLREHWAARDRRTKAHRSAARLVIQPRLMPREGELLVTLTRIAPRALDAHDNLASAFKAVVDGIADAFDCKDNDPRFVWAYAQRKGAPKQYGVEIRIELRKGGD